MPMSNEEILRMSETFFKKHNITKAEGGVIDLSNTNFGGILPRPMVEQMIGLTRKQNEWLSSINSVTRKGSTGNVPVFDFSEPGMEHVGENEGTPITNRPRTWNAPYACKKFRSDFYITTEELQEAAAAGMSAFETKMVGDWTKQLGNDVANCSINGDKSLGDETRLNRMLRGINGIKIQMASGNVTDAEGQAWGQGIYDAMLDSMPDKYADDGGLRWLFNRRVNTNWEASLTNVNTTERTRSALGDAVLTQTIKVPPLGIPQIIVPQISAHYGTVGTPDAVTDNTGSITFRVNDILVDTTDSTGRKVKVVYIPTGTSEVATVAYVSSDNVITTAGTLGQTTVSTTTTDYSIQIFDETDLYLTNPKTITMVMCSDWRSYREFNKNYDRFEITTYIQFDIIVPTPEVSVMFNRVRVTPIETWS